MKTLLATAALSLAMLLAGCAEAPPRAAAPKPAPQGLKFTYPTGQRHVVELSGPEREFMLNEMRYYLDMLWVSIDALSHDNLETVAKAARSRFPAMSALSLPPTLEAKLPREYQVYWRATHDQVEQLALTAETSRSTPATLHQLGQVLQRCNECHTTFQFQTR